jgi:hypothetical protein
VSSIAACAAISTGCDCDRFDVPLASLIVLVSEISEDRNSMLFVIRSQWSVRCSPTKASWNPSLSARMIAARSSSSTSRQSRCIGWTGIMNIPSFIPRVSARRSG